MERLSVKIRRVDPVIVGNADPPDSRRGEVGGGWRAQTSRAHDEDTRCLEALLTVDPKARQADLASIAPKLIRVEHPRLVRDGAVAFFSTPAVTGRGFHVLTTEIDAKKYTRPFECRTGVSLADVSALLKRLFVFFADRGKRKLVVE